MLCLNSFVPKTAGGNILDCYFWMQDKGYECGSLALC
jgi:hypothetical protein